MTNYEKFVSNFSSTEYFSNQTRHRITNHEKKSFSHHIFFIKTLFSLALFHREVRGQGHLKNTEPRAGGSSVSCSKLHQQGGCLPTQGLNPRPLFERFSLKPLGLPAFPDVCNAVSLATHKSRSCVIAAVMMPKQTHSAGDDRTTWPNHCESRSNNTELCGVRLPQFAWETAQTTELALTSAAIGVHVKS